LRRLGFRPDHQDRLARGGVPQRNERLAADLHDLAVAGRERAAGGDRPYHLLDERAASGGGRAVRQVLASPPALAVVLEAMVEALRVAHDDPHRRGL
jgi:hypothetical protein